jgi:phosphoglycerol transferase MdoB-like AlkP superfamily enzyme
LPIHKTIRYTDFALKHFFEKARQTDWYANTLFIITADHASTNEQASYQTEEGIYRIPLIIFDPQHPQPHQINTTTQQIDLMPFILEEVGYNKPYFAFGKSSTDSSGFAIQYLNNIYQWIQYPYVLQFDGERTLLFSKLDTNDILKICNEEKPKNNMEHRVKAFVQQYNDALIHNKTTLRY